MQKPSVIEQIISKNPGLSEYEYRLLVKYYQRYDRILHSVTKVFTMPASNGKRVIVYVTQATINHIRSGHFEFDELSDEQLANLIEKLLQEEPDHTTRQAKDGEQSVTYFYRDVEIDAQYHTIGIVVSVTKSGQVITIKTNQTN